MFTKFFSFLISATFWKNDCSSTWKPNSFKKYLAWGQLRNVQRHQKHVLLVRRFIFRVSYMLEPTVKTKVTVMPQKEQSLRIVKSTWVIQILLYGLWKSLQLWLFLTWEILIHQKKQWLSLYHSEQTGMTQGSPSILPSKCSNICHCLLQAVLCTHPPTPVEIDLFSTGVGRCRQKKKRFLSIFGKNASS